MTSVPPARQVTNLSYVSDADRNGLVETVGLVVSRAAGAQWKMENGKWRMENAESRRENLVIRFALGRSPLSIFHFPRALRPGYAVDQCGCGCEPVAKLRPENLLKTSWATNAL